MTEDQAKMLSAVHRAVIGEKSNGTTIVIGLVDRVRTLEKWKVLIVSALFAGSAAGNLIGRWWI